MKSADEPQPIFSKELLFKMLLLIAMICLFVGAGYLLGKEKSYQDARLYAENFIKQNCNSAYLPSQGITYHDNLSNIQWGVTNGTG